MADFRLLQRNVNLLFIFIFYIPPYLSELAPGRLFNYRLFEGGVRLFEGGANSREALIKKEINQYVMCSLTYTLRGLNFARIKFRGFRGFRKNREIKSRRKICNWPSAKLNPHEKI